MKSTRPFTRRAVLGGTGMTLVAAWAARAAEAPAAAKARSREPRLLKWEQLLPDQERSKAGSAPAPVHDYLGESGPAAQQTGSAAINPQLDGAYVKVPGFVVPLQLSQQEVVQEFLLVPYFGACIHTPPPPPNQIIYARLAKPARIRSIWDPYFVTGVLTVARKDTSMASTAYTIAGEKLEIYEFD